MKVNLLNGNGQRYLTGPMTIILLTEEINPIMHKHITEYTGSNKRPGLILKKNEAAKWYEAKPKTNAEIVRFLTMASTYSFKLAYTDNWNATCTLFFKYGNRGNRSLDF